MADKRPMPQEHRVSGVQPGEYQWIRNNYGTFLLVNVPFAEDEERYNYEYPDVDLVLEVVNEALMNEVDATNDAVQEKTSSLTTDEKEE